ncbi:sigma 54-interacting transcriptional regulator [Candidatus Nitrospira bockiana]
MRDRHILILDLGNQGCRGSRHDSLTTLVRYCLSPRDVQVHRAEALVLHDRIPRPDCVLLRPSPSTPVSDVVLSVKRRWVRVPILGLLCGEQNPASVSGALHEGLDDFLLCPFRDIELAPRLDRLLADEPIESSSAGDPARHVTGFRLDCLVGRAECFVRELEKIPLFAEAEATVLIAGETGTGKELFARAIHYHSARKAKPFVPVNCGALPDQLFENEMFGHVRGAFTNAFSHQQGLVAEADGGTLFLDEIDALSLSAQTKLLRFLQDRQYRPLGSSKGAVADVRIIAATNTDLRRQVETRRFREDLYYRLNILSLSIPPLRERPEDIPGLVAHFMHRYAGKTTRGAVTISPEALQKLLVHAWPGNVRELEGIIQRAMVLTTSSALEPDHLDLPPSPGRPPAAASSLREAKASAIRQFERAYLTKLLSAWQGNVSRAARAAGKERRAFQRLLDKYGLDRRAFQER